jgi:hypothetical protein
VRASPVPSIGIPPEARKNSHQRQRQAFPSRYLTVFTTIHNLTIGHLDTDAIDERRAIVLRPLDPGVVAKHLRALGTRDKNGWTLDGMPVEEKAGYLVGRWLVRGATWSRRNSRSGSRTTPAA